MSRATVITLSALLLVGLVAAVTIGYLSYANDDENKKPTTSTKAVEEMCQPTDYKEACYKSLSKVNSDDPKELVKAAFMSTIAELSEVANKSRTLKELENDPKTSAAVQDCKELFQDAVDDLQRSFVEIGEFDFNKVDKMLENLKIWLSATLTYQETCLDGFDNSTGDASDKVRKILQLSMQMSSNGLAIVTQMSTLLGTIDMSSFSSRRRLLFDESLVTGHFHEYDVIPYWLRSRRLLNSMDDNVEGHGDSTGLEDGERDTRQRRLLRDVTVLPHEDDDELPTWLDGGHRKLLEATNLEENLKKKANVTVAKDGSGKYKTIEQALTEIPKNGNESFIIYIKEGVYNEYLVFFKWMTHVVLVGDGPTKTRITNNKNFADGVRTFKTATLSVLGDHFMAKDIGIENSAGAIKHQAVALRVQSDQSIFYNCHMDGYQDTLYTHTYRQFYRDCRVTGTIDFIFGDAAAFFQNCTFVVRKPLENQRCIVTAQGRMERHQPTGIIIHKCRFEADPDYYPVRKTNTAFLGRPWKEYSKTVIMESHIDDSISPDGWLPWEGNFALETCYYGEYNNFGPGSDMANRVKWRGIKTILQSRAESLMPPEWYGTDEWIRSSRVPYDPTLDTIAPGPEGSEDDSNAPQGAPSFASSFLSSSSSSSSGGHSSSSSSKSASSQGSSSSSSSSTGESTTGTNGGGSTDLSSTSTTPTTSKNKGSTGGSSTASNTPTSTGDGSSTIGNVDTSTGDGSTTTGSTGTSTVGDGSTTSNTGTSTGGGSSSTGTSTGGGSSSTGTSTGEGSSTTGTSTDGGSFTTGTSTDGGSSTDKSGSTIGSSTSGDGSTIGTTVDTPSQSPLSVETPAPTPTIAAVPTTLPLTTVTLPPTTTTQTDIATINTSSKISNSSPTTEQNKKQTGPITVRELERILMTNEEMEGQDDDAGSDDMSGNVPDGDEPSPASVPNQALTPAPGPTPTASISITPSASPSDYNPSLGPSPSPSPSPSTSPSESPSDEIPDWLPPATAPEPDTEPADKEPPTNAPKKSNGVRLNSMMYDLQVGLSSMLIWIVLAM